MISHSFFHRALFAAMFAGVTIASQAATVVATYNFGDTLAADELTAPTLVSIDPFSSNGFETALVNGVSRRVFHWVGDGIDATRNAGLSLDATGLVSYDNYSVEMTFEFLTLPAYGGGWRRIVDTQNRQSDNGFYVDPDEYLQVYPDATGTTTFTTPGFHNVVLTNFVVGGKREVKAYLDGKLELTSDTDQLNLDNSNNPGHLLNFFVDNLAGPAQQEYADGRIAFLRLYDGVVAVPEPTSLVLMLAGLSAVGFTAKRTRRLAA